MDKIFNITSSFKAESKEKGINISGLASACGTDRAGDVIPAEAWKKGGLHDFKKNPIILFNHNYDAPIGKATSIEPTEEGLQMEAFISKSAPGGIGELIKDGVLGAFSVGFRIKDADYIEETGGLLIKDAELFEVSVVSVPCNQDAVFSISKSFSSDEEYKEFRATFKDSVDLAGQNLAKEEANASNIASDTPDGADKAHMEINMDQKELEAFAKKVAEDTAAKIAMKQAEDLAVAEKAAAEKAAADAEAEKAAAEAEAETKATIKTGIESGAERLLADVESKLAEKDADMAKVLEQFAKDMQEKNEEITKMRESKRVFSDREGGNVDGLTKFGKEFMYAHMLGVMSGKGMDTDYARGVYEKAGIAYDGTGEAPDIAQEIASQIEKEVQLNLKLASAFREIKVEGASTVLPIQPDAGFAAWQTGAATAGNLENRTQITAATYSPEQVILRAYRLISQTYMDNHIDEEVLINLMPMLVESVARAHARSVDTAILNGESSTISGLEDYATASTGGSVDLDGATVASGNSATLTALMLMNARKQMGKYGLDPADVAYVVSQARYYDLIADPEFADISEVGAMAQKLKGAIGSVYGSPVIISDNFEAEANTKSVAYAVATRNYAIPRLRSIKVEQDYEVGNQRRVIVATQSLGFTELVADEAANQSCVKITAVT